MKILPNFLKAFFSSLHSTVPAVERTDQASQKLSAKFSDQVDGLFEDAFSCGENVFELKHGFLDILDKIEDELPDIANNFTKDEISELFQIFVIEFDESQTALPEFVARWISKIKTHRTAKNAVMALGFIGYLRQIIRVETELHYDEVSAGDAIADEMLSSEKGG